MHSFSNLRKSALQAYMDSKQRERRVTLKVALLILFAVGLVISGLAYAGYAIATDPELKAQVLNPDNFSAVTSLFGGGSSNEEESETGDAAGGAALALPSPLPTNTAHPTITPTPTNLYTDTPLPSATPTFTPTVTPTPSITPTPSSTFTPTPTGSGEPRPPSTDTATPAPTEISFPDCDPSVNAGFDSALLALINSERESEGLAAYESQSKLVIAARLHSTDMACNDFFSHTGSDGSTVGERVAGQGYEASRLDQTIFRTPDTSSNAPQLAFDFWMASPPTRAVILDEDFTEVGISYIFESSSTFGGYFTVVFAQP